MMRKYRVLAWGTGYLETQGLGQIIEDPTLELVDLKVADPTKCESADIAVVALAGCSDRKPPSIHAWATDL